MNCLCWMVKVKYKLLLFYFYIDNEEPIDVLDENEEFPPIVLFLTPQKEDEEIIVSSAAQTPSDSSENKPFKDDREENYAKLGADGEYYSPEITLSDSDNNSWLGSSDSEEGLTYYTNEDCSTPTDKLSHMSSLYTVIGIFFNIINSII